jgi:hypothetical protein
MQDQVVEGAVVGNSLHQFLLTRMNLCCLFGMMCLMLMRMTASVIIKFHRFLKLKTSLLLLRSRQSVANLGTLLTIFDPVFS